MGCFPVDFQEVKTLSFLSLFFFGKGKGNHPKNKDFLSLPNPKIPGKEGENAQKKQGFLAGQKKKQGNSQKTRKGRTGKKAP